MLLTEENVEAVLDSITQDMETASAANTAASDMYMAFLQILANDIDDFATNEATEGENFL